MSSVTERQKIILRGLSAVSWRRPQQIAGYASDQRFYYALQKLVREGRVESRLRGTGTGDSKEYRISVISADKIRQLAQARTEGAETQDAGTPTGDEAPNKEKD